jgi:hypothetical protein
MGRHGEVAGAEEAPDGHAGGAYSVFLAEVGASLPAVAGAGGRIIEEDEEFVEESDGTSVGVLGVLQSMLEGIQTGNTDWRKLGFKLIHDATLTHLEKRRYR